jgi:hypothetical protein
VQREKQRRAPMVQKEVLESLEAKCCAQIEISLIPCLRRSLDELENKAIALHICLKEFTPALRSSLSNLGILERAAIKCMGTKHQIALMVRTAKVFFLKITQMEKNNIDYANYHPGRLIYVVFYDWQDQDTLMTALTDFESSVSAVIEALHPDILNSEFPSNYLCNDYFFGTVLSTLVRFYRNWRSEACCQKVSL